MKKIILTLVLATSAVGAFAQYTGPGANAPDTTTSGTTPTTVKQLLDSGKDDQHVTLRGHITRSVGDEKYEFADSTGQVLVEIDGKRWPAGHPVNEKSTVELTGKYDKELVGKSKVEVKEIKIIQ